jgi:hypothetical protein
VGLLRAQRGQRLLLQDVEAGQDPDRAHQNGGDRHPTEDEEAVNLRFGKGPYGFDKFVEKERSWLKQRLGWEPPGMTFLGLIGLKSALEISKNPGNPIDLQTLVRRMGADRDLYDESIRQKKVQHIILVPSTVNFEILVHGGHEK